MSDIITLAHGAGGRAMQQLLEETVSALYDGQPNWEDAAAVNTDPNIAVTTDSFTVSPLVFPGGDIGTLAATGTINDLAMRAAVPRYLTVGFIIEEGLQLGVFENMVGSLREACDDANVEVIAGDTKVVGSGSADGLFINTTGIGELIMQPPPGIERAELGDKIIINGYVGDHGAAVLAAREELPLQISVSSDCAGLGGLVANLMEAVGPAVHTLRDPTRGGLAAVLNEIAGQAKLAISIEEDAVPVRSEVRGLCELLGFDALQLANEGKLVAFVAPHAAEAAVHALKNHPLGEGTAIIGEVVDGPAGRVAVRTAMGTSRVLTMPTGELLPRIC